jgi:glucose/arabinose dehydrogenase
VSRSTRRARRDQLSATKAAPAAPLRRRAVVERLEARQLLAGTPVQVPAGFQESVYVQDSTPTHLVLGQLTAMEFAPDGRLFVLEKKGNVKIITDGVVNPTPFFSVAVDGFAERGLDGIALDPNFATNGYVYLYYTAADPAAPNQSPNNAKNRLIRVTANPSNPDVALAGSAVTLVDGIASDTGIHNGGSLHFGPDGMLYVGTGESGTPAYANDLSSLNGKILRLNVAAYPASIVPADNPFVNTPGARGEIWAYGFRNVFSSAFDPVTGRFFANDVGGTKIEEVDEIVKGGNYGWPVAEGTSDLPDVIDPIYEYAHGGNNDLGIPDSAITGGVFYRGDQFPAEYQGKYFFADYTRHFIRVLDPATGQATTFVDPSLKDVIDLDVGPDGSLYALGYQWRVLKYTYDPNANRVPLVEAPTADVLAGGVPLTVTFAAAATDADGDPLTYTWDFGDGTPAAVGAASISHTYTTGGSYKAKVTVTDGKGGSATSDELALTPGNEPPKITITATKTYTAGQPVTFSATAVDPEDGVLDANAFDWRVVFHHSDHTHPFLDSLPDRAGDTFTVPAHLGENSPSQFYRVEVTVTDSFGLLTTATADVTPQVGKFTLTSNVPGLELKLDEAPAAGPIVVEGVVGSERSIEAPLTAEAGAVNYAFVGWSDGGAAAHVLPTPAGDKTYTAEYRAVGPADLAVSAVAGKLPAVLVAGARKVPTAKVTVSNVGPIDVDATGDVVLLASADGTPDADDAVLGTLAGAALKFKVGKAKAYKVKLDAVPGTLADANYQILAVLRNTAGVTDFDPANDSMAMAATVRIAPPFVSLVNEWGRQAALAADGKRRTTAVAVRNAGTISASGTVRVTVYLSADGVLDAATDPSIGTLDAKVKIKPDGTKVLKVPYAVPAGTAPGSYTVLVDVAAVAPLVDVSLTDNAKGGGLVNVG